MGLVITGHHAALTGCLVGAKLAIRDVNWSDTFFYAHLREYPPGDMVGGQRQVSWLAGHCISSTFPARASGCRLMATPDEILSAYSCGYSYRLRPRALHPAGSTAFPLLPACAGPLTDGADYNACRPACKLSPVSGQAGMRLHRRSVPLRPHPLGWWPAPRRQPRSARPRPASPHAPAQSPVRR